MNKWQTDLQPGVGWNRKLNLSQKYSSHQNRGAFNNNRARIWTGKQVAVWRHYRAGMVSIAAITFSLGKRFVFIHRSTVICYSKAWNLLIYLTLYDDNAKIKYRRNQQNIYPDVQGATAPLLFHGKGRYQHWSIHETWHPGMRTVV
jgi:hypothetical protein